MLARLLLPGGSSKGPVGDRGGGDVEIEVELGKVDRGRPVASERVPDGMLLAAAHEVAPTTPPLELTATLPSGHAPGQSFLVWGPHGPLELAPPPDTQPGSTLRYRLAPPIEFRVEVPPGAEAGSQVSFRKPNGDEVAVAVPEGLVPGDSFEVAPPALMVRVPAGVRPGDFVVFQCGNSWRRARVPDGLGAGHYFAAAPD
mmetsp:Transcript_15429/g.42410  ORF Transcript_15429/g.42410 Transcript_15429/m.42410 type:complete len:200 (-) Transcript_15429:39-638(-)